MASSEITLSEATAHYVELRRKHVRGGFPAFPVSLMECKDDTLRIF